MTDFPALLQRFCDAVERADFAGFAALFADDAVYHDYIYGPFRGRQAIAHMLEKHFWGTARAYRWQMLDPVFDGRIGYARYLFSFTSTLEWYRGRRVLLEGTSIFRIDPDGRITEYRETANGLAAMSQLGVDPERMASRGRKWADDLRARPEAAMHLDPAMPNRA